VGISSGVREGADVAGKKDDVDDDDDDMRLSKWVREVDGGVLKNYDYAYA
jgi:hypothetical protein